MTSLTGKQKEEILQIVEETLTQLQKDIKDLQESSKPVSPDNAIGRLSRMEAIGQKSVKDAALRRAQGRVEKLNLVKDQIHDEDYGICRECDEPIPLGRLKSLPESIVCVECLESAEKDKE